MAFRNNTDYVHHVNRLCLSDCYSASNSHPSTADKLNVAQSLVGVFPSLNVSIHGDNLLSLLLCRNVGKRGFF